MNYPYENQQLSFEKRAEILLSLMTIEEKVSQMLHFSPAIDRLSIPAYTWWNEALHGIARAGTATVFPQAIALAATFDKQMVYQTATYISDEARAKHHEYKRQNDMGIYKGLTMWSPNINIFRDPRWGRGHETYGEDPYLTGRMGISFIKGMQGDHPKYLKTIATPKHYLVHSGPESDRHHFDAVVSKKDLRETYLPAFKECIVEGQAYSIMGAYNRTNGEACCASRTFLLDILRDEFSFKGFVVSDCHAIIDLHLHHHLTKTPQESAAMAVKNGCDLNCGKAFESLTLAYEENIITEEQINKAVKRLLVAKFKLGMFDDDDKVPYSSIPYEVNDSNKHRDYAIKVAEKSLVLLKNSGILPLKSNVKSIAVIGPNADDREVLLANYKGIPSRYSTILEGIIEKFSDCEIKYSKGCHIANTTLRDDETSLISEAISCAKACDVTILVTGINSLIEGEEADPRYPEFGGGDREDIELPGLQNQLISKISTINKPLIIVNLSGSCVSLVTANEHADAIIQAWYPGALGGKAVANLLAGDFSPSGKLPVTFYNSIKQLPSYDQYELTTQTYRYLKEAPLFPFGFGLTYSKFSFGNININKKSDYLYEVTIKVINDGPYDSNNVIQLYIKTPKTSMKSPHYQLKRFSNEFFKVNQQKEITFTLDEQALSFITDEGKRVILDGEYTIYIDEGQPNKSTQKALLTIEVKSEIKY